MKINHVITGLPSAGAENFLQRIVFEGHRRGHVHEVINFGPPTDLAKTLSCKARVYNLDIKRQPLSAMRLLLKLRQSQPDAIFGWMYYGTAISPFFRRKPSVKLVGNIRHTPVSKKNETKRIQLALWIVKKMSGHFDLITYNSKHSKEWHEEYGFADSRSAIIDNGYTRPTNRPDQFIDVKAQDNPQYPFRIGAAARNHPMKNFSGLLEAFEVAINQGANLHIEIVGRGTENLKKLSAYQRVKQHVKIHGECSDMEAFYGGLDLFVSFSSWGESFQNVIAEAMLAGVPALCTNIGAARKIVLRPEFVVEPEDNKALTQQILSLEKLKRDDINTWRKLGIDCHLKIAKTYSIEAAYTQLVLKIAQ